MRYMIRRRPSPALVVAVVALVAALAGTAIAGPGASTSAKAVTKAKVKKIAKKQVNKALPLGAADIGPAAVLAGQLGQINERSQTFTINSGQSVAQTVSCQTGEKVISGGGRFNTEPLANIAFTQYDYRVDNGWRAGGANGTGANQQYTVYAYCLQASP
jgi:hypothetical protein